MTINKKGLENYPDGAHLEKYGLVHPFRLEPPLNAMIIIASLRSG